MHVHIIKLWNSKVTFWVCGQRKAAHFVRILVKRGEQAINLGRVMGEQAHKIVQNASLQHLAEPCKPSKCTKWIWIKLRLIACLSNLSQYTGMTASLWSRSCSAEKPRSCSLSGVALFPETAKKKSRQTSFLSFLGKLPRFFRFHLSRKIQQWSLHTPNAEEMPWGCVTWMPEGLCFQDKQV